MKKVCATLFVLAVVLAAIAAGGCMGIGNPLGNSTSTPDVVYGPISPTPEPTLEPTPTEVISPTPDVVVVNSQASDKVKLLFAPQDSKVFNWSRDIDGQVENISMIVVNDDSKPAKNVRVDVSMRDNQGQQLLFQEFTVGDIGRGERKLVVLTTKSHGDTTFAIVDFKVTWGSNGEFYNDQFPDHYLTAYM